MTGGVDMGYLSDGLRAGGRQALDARDTALGAAGLLRPVVCAPGSLGVVAGAEALAAAVGRMRDAHVALAERVGSAHANLDARAGRVAAEGDGLTARTAEVARTGAPTAGSGVSGFSR